MIRFTVCYAFSCGPAKCQCCVIKMTVVSSHQVFIELHFAWRFYNGNPIELVFRDLFEKICVILLLCVPGSFSRHFYRLCYDYRLDSGGYENKRKLQGNLHLPAGKSSKKVILLIAIRPLTASKISKVHGSLLKLFF